MPPVVAHAESARINLRTSPQAKAMIERAAALTGATASSRIVNQVEAITLPQEAFEAFVSAGENPPEPTPALIKLMTNAK